MECTGICNLITLYLCTARNKTQNAPPPLTYSWAQRKAPSHAPAAPPRLIFFTFVCFTPFAPCLLRFALPCLDFFGTLTTNTRRSLGHSPLLPHPSHTHSLDLSARSRSLSLTSSACSARYITYFIIITRYRLLIEYFIFPTSYFLRVYLLTLVASCLFFAP